LKVALLALGGEPAVCKRVAKLMRVDVTDPGLGCPTTKQLRVARGRHRPLSTDPKRGII
jgi:hypothetical protein